MGARDIERQALNVEVMRLLGANVHAVTSGTQTLKDATNEAFRVWAQRVEDTFYVIGSVVGAHPYPFMVREFQKIIGIEARRQTLERYGRLPSDVIACVGGGSNAMGIFAGFVDDAEVKLWGVEAGGKGLDGEEHAASLQAGSVGVLHGSRSYLLQSAEGQVRETHSISAGLDYPGVGPEHAFFKESGRATYVNVTDAQAIEAFHGFARSEGIVPALESAHAIAFARKLAARARCGRFDPGESQRPGRQRHRSMLEEVFARAHREKRLAFVPYVMAGDPDLETTEAMLLTLSSAGADVIELGVPYSDPLADGPTIAAAGQRALGGATHLRGVLELASRVPRALRADRALHVLQPGLSVRHRTVRARGGGSRHRRRDRSRRRARGERGAARRAGSARTGDAAARRALDAARTCGAHRRCGDRLRLRRFAPRRHRRRRTRRISRRYAVSLARCASSRINRSPSALG